MPIGWFMGFLCLVFVVAKLWGVINWSWWLVLLPLYGPGLVFLAVLLFAGLVALVVAIFK